MTLEQPRSFWHPARSKLYRPLQSEDGASLGVPSICIMRVSSAIKSEAWSNVREPIEGQVLHRLVFAPQFRIGACDRLPSSKLCWFVRSIKVNSVHSRRTRDRPGWNTRHHIDHGRLERDCLYISPWISPLYSLIAALTPLTSAGRRHLRWDFAQLVCNRLVARYP